MHGVSRQVAGTRFFSQKKGDIPDMTEEFNPDKPYKYSTSGARTYRSIDNFAPIPLYEAPAYQNGIVVTSLMIFVAYFAFLREENDIDERLTTRNSHVDEVLKKTPIIQEHLRLKTLEEGKKHEELIKRLKSETLKWAKLEVTFVRVEVCGGWGGGGWFVTSSSSETEASLSFDVSCWRESTYILPTVMHLGKTSGSLGLVWKCEQDQRSLFFAFVVIFPLYF